MIVRLLEYYQDAQNHFAPEQEVEVDEVLGAYLVVHKKAVQVVKHLEIEPQFEQAEEPPHYGGQVEQELRQDENKYQEFKKPQRGRGGRK